ncbi:MAG: phage tail protein I [Hyphomonadaceae bacterium]|nr:phage tail protein I [Hyphomonadaceae bacterium]
MLDQSLLPLNSTTLERAIETALKLDLPVRTGDLWNPQACPAQLLPWLAWALSVDTWDANWPEAIQRRVIANSPAVHRAKGTRAAVIAALDSLMVKAGIIEWWQPGGSGVAGTFIIRAYVSARWSEGGPLLTPELNAAILAMVQASAPASRPATLEIGVAAEAKVGVAMAVNQPLKIVQTDVDLAPPRRLSRSLAAALVVHHPLKIICHDMELAA